MAPAKVRHAAALMVLIALFFSTDITLPSGWMQWLGYAWLNSSTQSGFHECNPEEQHMLVNSGRAFQYIFITMCDLLKYNFFKPLTTALVSRG